MAVMEGGRRAAATATGEVVGRDDDCNGRRGCGDSDGRSCLGAQ
jgi:hypothetical protein